MCILFIFFLLQGVLVSDSVIINSYGQPVATSYSYRVDGNEKGHGYGYGYSKNIGYGKVVVTTYLTPAMPQPMTAASSYSTYIIHPFNMKGCTHGIMDSENAGSFRRVYGPNKADAAPMGGYEEEVKTEFTVPDFNAPDTDDENMIDAKRYRGWYEEEVNKEFGVPSFDVPDVDDENMIDADAERYRGWYEDHRNKYRGVGYWNKLKDEFDAYYNDKYREFFGKDYEDDEEDGEEYRASSDYGFGNDYGEKGAYDEQPEFGFKPNSDSFDYRYELDDKDGREW